MSWIAETLDEFGKQRGIGPLALGRNNALMLAADSGGVLAIELVNSDPQDEMLVSRGWPISHDKARQLRRALAKAHHAPPSARVVQVGSCTNDHNDLLLCVLRIPAREFTIQTLGHAIDFLERWHKAH